MASHSNVPQNPTNQHVSALLPKLDNDDPDYRFMALNDLQQMLQIGHPSFLQHDYVTCAKVVEGLLQTLVDSNGEVQNMAIKCLGPFVNRANEQVLCPMLDKLSVIKTDNTVDQSIPALALREVVVSFPRPMGVPRPKEVDDAYNAISRVLIPRLVGYHVLPPVAKNSTAVPKPGMIDKELQTGTDSNALDVLIEVARCFGPVLLDKEVEALQKIALEVVEHNRASSTMKKKAVTGLSVLANYFSDSLLSSFISRLIEHLRDSHLTPTKRKLYITILGSMAQSIPRKFGRYLATLAPFVLSALSEQELDDDMEADEDEERDPELDEVREAALVAIESFLAFCSQDMRAYTDECINAATIFLKWDPNTFGADDDDGMASDADEDALEDDDFEEEQGYDEDDDNSWRLRRSAAKVLRTLISTRSNGDLLSDGTLYARVAPVLVSRFKEREESVRLEILAALSCLVRNSGSASGSHFASTEQSSNTSMGPPPSRKRRRGGSDASMFDINASSSLSLGFASPTTEAKPTTGPRANLEKISPEIVRGVSQYLKSGTPATKGASIVLLKDIVVTQYGGLQNFLDQLLGPVIDTAKSSVAGSTGGAASAMANSLRIQAFQLVGAIADTHTSKSLQPFLPKIVPALVQCSKEKYGKLSEAAVAASEHIISAITPPRAASLDARSSTYLGQLFDTLVDRISTNEADLEVRKSAIRALGVLLGRLSGTQGVLAPSKRTTGLDLLGERLRNELTRESSVHAIEVVAAHAKDSAELPSPWVCGVALELSAQLRKASRSLRGSSLSGLRTIALNPASRQQLDMKSKTEIVGMLIPLLDASDLHLLGPALIILAAFVRDDAQHVMTAQLNAAICRIASGNISGNTLEALLVLVRGIGERGAGLELMSALLKDVGINGTPEVVGRVIGNLLVAGGGSIGITLDQFVGELQNTNNDDKRKCLALGVLGEAAMRLGNRSPLEPDLFMEYCSAKSKTVPMAAAVALGRAGAGSIDKYLPKIVAAMGRPTSPQYLLLHSIKEILQHAGGVEAQLIPYAERLWDTLLASSQAEDNKAIGAECLGRLAILDPKTYVLQLQSLLYKPKASVRGMAIAALRFTLAETDEAYDEILKPVVVPMLLTMLKDVDLDNRRLALTTFNSAMHNKPDMILPELWQLLPMTIKETYVKEELIREVQMGPFKHKVDDGLELRKSAYETLYAVLETAFSRLSVTDFSDCYDRVVAGVSDEHDIRTMCNVMITKLMDLAPDETKLRLESLAHAFRKILEFKAKENAVKQEIEKVDEGKKGVIKLSVLLNKKFGGDSAAVSGGHAEAGTREWAKYLEYVKKDHEHLHKAAVNELKERAV